MDLHDVMKILGVWCLLLTILGTIGNLLIILVCVTKLRSQVTFVFIAFLAAVDCLSLYEWNLTHFYEAFHISSMLVNGNLIICRLISFSQYITLHSSAWLLVIMSVERFISIYMRQWRMVYFKAKQAIITCIVVIVIMVLVNTNVLFLYGFDITNANGTYIYTACWEIDGIPETYWMTTWSSVHSFMYSYVPFLLLAISNFLLIFTLHRQRRASKLGTSTGQSRRQRSMTITIVIITLLFILFTGTGAVVNFFLADLLQTYSGMVIITLGDTLCFTFHAMNIFSLLAANKKFREEMFRLVSARQSAESSFGASTSEPKERRSSSVKPKF